MHSDRMWQQCLKTLNRQEMMITVTGMVCRDVLAFSTKACHVRLTIKIQ